MCTIGGSFNLKWVRNGVEGNLERDGQNNVRRADYYLLYWFKHPEVLWALLAHFISRNIGYLMGDLQRFWELAEARRGGPPLADPFIEVLGAHRQALFALLEAMDYLVFHSLCPQLEIYEEAREHPQHAGELFVLLADEYGIDPWVVERWVEFFAFARRKFPDWVEDDEARQVVWQHSVALVIDAENQVEDRLLHDPQQTYLAPFGVTSAWLLDVVEAAGFTRLCFPLMPEKGSALQQNLRIFRLRGLKDFEQRVEAGRQLTAGLFLTHWPRCGRLITWAKLNRFHHGTRVDYNPYDFSLDATGPFASGRRHSPPVVTWHRHTGSWPEEPAKVPEFAHLQAAPSKLPHSVADRCLSRVPGWFAPFSGDHGLREHRAADLAEVVD